MLSNFYRLTLWREKGLNRSLITAGVIPVRASEFPDTNFQPLNEVTNTRLLQLDCIEEWFSKRKAKKGMLKGRVLAMKLFIKYTQVKVIDNRTFIKAQCSAEQKKSLDYSVKTVLGVNSGIQQCSCTCPAGIGWSAACKHVGALCFSLEYFTLTGKFTKTCGSVHLKMKLYIHYVSQH